MVFAASTAHGATKIYKSVDADGNVVYSDVAPNQKEEEAELVVEELNTFDSPPADVGEESPVVVLENDDPELLEQAPAYTDLRMVSPSNDEGVRANDGNIFLRAAVAPGLFNTHQLRFYLDGSPAGTVRGAGLQLHNVDRGTHQAKVAVVDSSGALIHESEMVTFHVLRYFKPPQARRAN